MLHVAVALCVLNDIFREAGSARVEVDGVRVGARGEFDAGDLAGDRRSTYDVEVDSPAAPRRPCRLLLSHVDEVAEIPRAAARGMTVERR